MFEKLAQGKGRVEARGEESEVGGVWSTWGLRAEVTGLEFIPVTVESLEGLLQGCGRHAEHFLLFVVEGPPGSHHHPGGWQKTHQAVLLTQNEPGYSSSLSSDLYALHPH